MIGKDSKEVRGTVAVQQAAQMKMKDATTKCIQLKKDLKAMGIKGKTAMSNNHVAPDASCVANEYQ